MSAAALIVVASSRSENRLIQVNYPGSGNNSQYVWDGAGHFQKIVESVGGTVNSTKQLIWCGQNICEGRSSSGVVTSQYFAHGQTINGSNYFYTMDHLGSIHELTNNAGNLQSQYEYDLFGQPALVQGSLISDFQYGGYYFQAASKLSLAVFRAYDAKLGRWLNRDPIAEDGGTNLYAYTANRPVRNKDLSGLDSVGSTGPFNNCMGYSCGANRTPGTPYGIAIGPEPGSPPGSFFGLYGFQCSLIKNDTCNCPCDNSKMIVFFFGLPGYSGSTDFLNSPFDSGHIGIHTRSYNMPGNPGWTEIPSLGYPPFYPPDPVQGDPLSLTPSDGAVVLNKYCCCKTQK